MKRTSGFLGYLRRNALYFILAFCILAVGLSVTLMLVSRENTILGTEQNGPIINEGNTDNEQNSGSTNDPMDDTPVSTVISFIMPVSASNKITEYSEELVYNPTLRRYETHKAIDFFAEEGASVFAVWDGTIESVDNSFLEGYTITIDHGDGLKTIYNSLSEEISVKVGSQVKQGDLIGEVSVSNRKENNEGAHLHFSMMEDGVIKDPTIYLTLDNK